jgi:hypothetical protein
MINSGDAVTLVPEYIDEVHKAFSHPIQQIWSMLLRERDKHEIISESHQ